MNTLEVTLALKRLIWANKDEDEVLSLWAMGPPEPLHDDDASRYSFEIVGTCGRYTVTVEAQS